MIITKGILEEKKESYLKRIEEGAIFVHPTDTIFGLGCKATDDATIKKLREIKNAPKVPFSIIAPSKEWILKNCEINEKAKEWLNKLPGPYTLILKLKNKKAVSQHVNPDGNTIGVRIPNHWISEYVKELGFPIISTSANLIGEEYTHDIDEFNPKITNNVDFIIYDGNNIGKPSDIIDLTQEEPRIIRRSKK